MLPAFDPGAASRYEPQILGTVNSGLQRRPDSSASLPVTVNGKATDEIVPLWKTEKAAIEEAIIRFQGNIPKAAAELGISPSTIYRKKVSWEAQERTLAKS